MIDLGAELVTGFMNQGSCLHLACFNIIPEVVEAILKVPAAHQRNFDVNLLDRQDNTPLHRLMNVFDRQFDKAVRIFTMLVGRGAQLNRVNFTMNTPLSVAIQFKHARCVEFCLHYNHETDARKETFNLNALVGMNREPLLLEALRSGNLQIFFLVASSQKTNLFDFFEDLNCLAHSAFYSYFAQLKILISEAKKRFVRHRLFKSVQYSDAAAAVPLTDADVPSLVINFPNMTQNKASMFPDFKVPKVRSPVKQPLDFLSQDFESISIVSSYIDSKRDIFGGSSSKQKKTTPHFTWNKSKPASNSIIAPKLSIKKSSFNLSESGHHTNLSYRLITNYPKQPGLAVEEQIDDFSAESSEEKPIRKMTRDSQDAASHDIVTTYEHPGDSHDNREAIRHVSRGIRPQTMIMRRHSTSKREEKAGVLSENIQIKIPIMDKHNTMSKINQTFDEKSLKKTDRIEGKTPPMSLKMMKHPGQTFSDLVIRKSFDPSEAKLLFKVYTKHCKGENIATFFHRRLEVYKQLVEQEARFPADLLLKAICSKCRQLAETDSLDPANGRKFQAALHCVSFLQDLLMSNLHRLLLQFLDIDEFKAVASGLAKQPQAFLAARWPTSPRLPTFNPETYKAASDHLIAVLEEQYERLDALLEQLQDPALLPNPKEVSVQAILSLAVAPGDPVQAPARLEQPRASHLRLRKAPHPHPLPRHQVQEQVQARDLEPPPQEAALLRAAAVRLRLHRNNEVQVARQPLLLTFFSPGAAARESLRGKSRLFRA